MPDLLTSLIQRVVSRETIIKNVRADKWVIKKHPEKSALITKNI